MPRDGLKSSVAIDRDPGFQPGDRDVIETSDEGDPRGIAVFTA
jgi:hypothetical protein